MYHAGPAREAFTLFYLVAMLFGVLRLNAARLMVLALLALAAHATVLHLSYLRDPSMNVRAALAEFGVLIIVLPWFAVMGGYVNRLRVRLRADRLAEPFSVCLVDLDQFKSINDTFGHAAGERVRAAVEASAFPGLPAQRRVTISVGVATHAKGEDVTAMLARADAALYEGKRAGRNRVIALG